MCKKLTIVILSFNHKKFITECLDSISSLSDIAKLIIIDDGSTDGTAEILSNPKYNKFQIIIKEKNKGLIDSHLIWKRLVKTEYVYLIASDDYVFPDDFRRAYKYINENSKNDAVIFGGLNYYDGRFWPVYGEKHKNFFKLNKTKMKREVFYNHPAPLLIQSTIFKTDKLKNLDALNGKVKFDDYPLFISLITGEYKLELNDSFTIVGYRHHGENTYKNYFKMYNMFVEVYENYCFDEQLRKKSIAYVWFLYLLRSIRGGHLKYFVKIFKKGNSFNVIHLPSFLYGMLKK